MLLAILSSFRWGNVLIRLGAPREGAEGLRPPTLCCAAEGVPLPVALREASMLVVETPRKPNTWEQKEGSGRVKSSRRRPMHTKTKGMREEGDTSTLLLWGSLRGYGALDRR